MPDQRTEDNDAKTGERSADIPQLAEYFRKLHARQFDKECEPFPPELLSYLENLRWLKSASFPIASRAIIVVGPEGLTQREATRARPSSYSYRNGSQDAVPLKKIAKEAIREMERNAIIEALRSNHWNRRKAAQDLKISYRALIYKIRDAGLIAKRTNAQERTESTTSNA